MTRLSPRNFVSFGGETVTGLLKELKVKLDKNSTTAAPLVKDFKIDITGVTTALDVKKGTVTSVEVTIPETKVTALATTDYEEKLKDKPAVLNGHTEAEFKRAKNAVSEGVDIASLSDGFNDQLKERKGPCSISAAPASSPKLAVPTDDVTVQERRYRKAMLWSRTTPIRSTRARPLALGYRKRVKSRWRFITCAAS